MAADYLVLLRAAYVGQTCIVEKRDHDWSFSFDAGLGLTTMVPWRVVTPKGIALADEDDGQLFGLPEPVDAAVRVNELLRDRRVSSLEVDLISADLKIEFDSELALQLFNNSSAYEGWYATFRDEGNVVTAIGMGGGGLNFY